MLVQTQNFELEISYIGKYIPIYTSQVCYVSEYVEYVSIQKILTLLIRKC